MKKISAPPVRLNWIDANNSLWVELKHESHIHGFLMKPKVSLPNRNSDRMTKKVKHYNEYVRLYIYVVAICDDLEACIPEFEKEKEQICNQVGRSHGDEE